MAKQAKQPMKDVIVLLPGILGSVLEKEGKEVWAPSPGAIGRALWRLGRNLNDLALGDDDWEVDDLGDQVKATRLMPDIHMIPGLWGIDGYSDISSMIRSTFDVTDDINFIEFPYDWRRDNRVAARQLKERTDRALHARRKEAPDAELVLVGHSMGGIVSRYFLECLDGWHDTRALITFGTPYRGSMNAVDFLANGFVKKVGPLKLVDLTTLLHSLTSVYQLLPRYPSIDLDDGKGYVRPSETGGQIAGLDVSRAAAALAFQHEIDDGAAAHDFSAYAIHSIVGSAQGTKQSARLEDGRLLLEEKDFQGNNRRGDGTVPRVSATPIEAGDTYQPMYSSDKHGSLQNDDAVRTQLAGILTAQSTSAFRGEEYDKSKGIPVDLPELLSVGEPLDLRAGPARSGLTLGVDVVDLETGRSVHDSPILLTGDGDGFHHGVVPPLPSGDFRVRVAGVGDSATLADPVHSLLCVFDDAELE